MKTFNEKYDLTNIPILKELVKRTGETHAAIQQVEAGIEGTKTQKAAATFQFLDLLGYYPDVLVDPRTGRKDNVLSHSLVAIMGGAFFFTEFALDTGESVMFPLCGPKSGAGAITLDVASVNFVVKAAFPKAVIQTTTGTSKSGQTIYHTSVRPAFMQDEGARGFPMESGSCECSNEAVSIMQATVRMIAAALTAGYATALLKEAAKPTKTLSQIAAEKYGNKNWMLDALTGKNHLLDALNYTRGMNYSAPSRRTPADKAAQLASMYSGKPTFQPSAQHGKRAAIDDLLKMLKDLGIDVQVVSL